MSVPGGTLPTCARATAWILGSGSAVDRGGRHELLEGIRAWARNNADEALRPTGRNMRNLNPIVVPGESAPALELGWWGS